MAPRLAVGAGTVSLIALSLLVASFPLASAQTTTVISIPLGSGVPKGAPGYSPDKATVVIGVNNTVEWTNNDTVAHTVTSAPGNGSVSSGNLAVGATYTYTFTTPGTYDIVCLYHTWMTGTVVVLASTSSSTSSTHTTAEFPTAALAVVLFAVIAAVIVVAPRMRSKAVAGATPPPMGA
jgi:plastocyanin